MDPFINKVKEICTEVYIPMESADGKKVLHALGDPYGLVLRPQTENIENTTRTSPTRRGGHGMRRAITDG